ncbi:MAG: alpha/beta hydrolase [Pseudomonadales bacterium]
MKLFFTIVAGYGVLVLVAFLLQRQLLYYPEPNAPTADHLQNLGLRFWPTADSFRGFVANGALEHSNGTVVVFHGNAGAAWQRGYYVDALQPLGYQVVLAEYPGYAGRSGSPSEKALVIDARETVQQVYEQFGGPLILWGESLGCGIAAALVADSSVPLNAVVMLTPWDNLPRMAQSAYWFLPARWFVRDKYDNTANLRNFEGPVAVLIAEQDQIIPNAHSKLLYESLAGPKKLWVFPNAGHNTWPTTFYAGWWREVMAFVTNKY